MAQTFEKWLAWWGLNRYDLACDQSFFQSRLLRIFCWPFFWLRQLLLPYATQSQAAQQWIPWTASVCTILLLLISPFVDSTPTALLILAASFFTGLHLLLREEKLALGALGVLVLLFIAWGLVATGFSPFFKLSLYGYSKTLTYLLAYFCFLVNLKQRWAIYAALWGIIFSATIVSVYGLYQWHIQVPPLALWDDPSADYKLTRVYSFLGNPNLLGGYLLPTLSLTGFLFFVQRGIVFKLILLGSFGVQMACLYFTYCRGAWIALVGGGGIAFIVWLILYREIFQKHRWLKYVFFALCLLGLAGAIYFVLSNPALMERVRSLTSGAEHSSNQFRINVWFSSLELIRAFFWTGIGMGNQVFVKVYTYYMATGFQALSTYNIFLETWVEMGIFGFLLFLGILLSHSARCFWGILRESPMAQRLLLAGSLTLGVTLVLHGMVDTVFYRPPIQLLFWFGLALISVLSQEVWVDGTASER